MERLRIAIEKARAERLAQPGPAAAPPRPAAKAPARPVPPNSPLTAATALGAERAPSAPSPSPIDAQARKAAWDELSPLETPRRGALPNEASPAAQAYNLLRARVIQQARRNGWRRIALVSPDPGDGKTTTALALASGLTRQDDTHSLVLDLDLRRIGLSRALGSRVRVGMDEVLSDGVPFEKAARVLGGNVAFGLNAQPSTRAGELLQSEGAAAALDGIEEAYAPDLTICDMPPLLVAEDNIGFLEKVDCALIIVAAEHTPMSRIDTAERQVAELTQVMGIVLNKCRYPDRRSGYGYDY